MNYITVNTDASFHPQKRVGGYAFVIVSDKFRVRKSGGFKSKPKDPTAAEIMAIGNAFHYLGLVTGFTAKTVVVNCDAKFAMHAIEVNPKSPLARRVRKIVDATLRHLGGAKIEFRHVKAHSGIDDARSHINEWCDKMAKARMWECYHHGIKPKPRAPRKKFRREPTWQPYKD